MRLVAVLEPFETNANDHRAPLHKPLNAPGRNLPLVHQRIYCPATLSPFWGIPSLRRGPIVSSEGGTALRSSVSSKCFGMNRIDGRIVTSCGQKGRTIFVKNTGPTVCHAGQRAYRKRGLSPDHLSISHVRHHSGLFMREVARMIAPSAGCCGTLPMKVLAIRPGRCFSLSHAATCAWPATS